MRALSPAGKPGSSSPSHTLLGVGFSLGETGKLRGRERMEKQQERISVSGKWRSLPVSAKNGRKCWTELKCSFSKHERTERH